MSEYSEMHLFDKTVKNILTLSKNILCTACQTDWLW